MRPSLQEPAHFPALPMLQKETCSAVQEILPCKLGIAQKPPLVLFLALGLQIPSFSRVQLQLQLRMCLAHSGCSSTISVPLCKFGIICQEGSDQNWMGDTQAASPGHCVGCASTHNAGADSHIHFTFPHCTLHVHTAQCA